ncbi:Uncharacterized protein OBRU01_10080 [Operophtera brumata]|uniref:Uncharacterized protein n=1 Tax=Operophtera brumata TaxID=104452 RepID=A0A0L7LF68_OPEBR|nr:Uncharacterized protein OBRU01_10080 [Operophtera brumata]
MWEYLAILLIGFWLGVAIFLYISCYWLDELLDLPPLRNGSQSSASSRPSSGASNAHVHLKRLVNRVVEEAASLPALARYAAEPHTPTIESSTYEDLLASAILNKVICIHRFQRSRDRLRQNSNVPNSATVLRATFDFLTIISPDLPPLRNGSQSSASSRPSSGASNAHVHLKRLVNRVVEEAASLPALARYAAEPHTPTIESSTYEDLLASAILNKNASELCSAVRDAGSIIRVE